MNHKTPHNIPITSWATEDKPREKLLVKGKTALTDAELLAIILGSGSKEESAVSLAKRILRSANNNLNDLSRYSIEDFMKFKGIGEAKAISITALLELGRRREVAGGIQKIKIRNSRDCFNAIGPLLKDLNHEEFWVVLLDRANHILNKEQISKGGFSATIVDPKVIFKKVLDKNASSLVLCHNHPSGNLKPSNSDIELTQKLVAAAKMLDITILDHLIVAQSGYFSFSDEGQLPS